MECLQDLFDVAGGCLGTHRRAKKSFVSQGTLDTIDQSRRARLIGRAELFRELRRKTVCAQRVDKEAYVRGICEGVEHHLWSSDSRPAFRGIRALHSSKPVPRCPAVFLFVCLFFFFVYLVGARVTAKS